MPKPQRRPEEIEAVKDEILGQALALLAEDGYDGFSMRKLAARLGIAAKTIYNYYRNQDELYLCILTRGFEDLRAAFEAAARRHDTPEARLKAAAEAYVAFGLDHPNLYNLMFTWHVPKFNDYVGTPVEPIAQAELETALGCPAYFIALMADCLPPDSGIDEKTLQDEMILVWAPLHGFVAGINNTLLDYMHPDPRALAEQVVQRVAGQLRRQLEALADRGSLTVVPRNE